MKLGALVILNHCRSTDDKPIHLKSPAGEESWCFYNRAIWLLQKNKIRETQGEYEDHIDK